MVMGEAGDMMLGERLPRDSYLFSLFSGPCRLIRAGRLAVLRWKTVQSKKLGHVGKEELEKETGIS